MNRSNGHGELATTDPREFRRACAAFGTGVTVVTTRHGGSERGITVNAFMSVSLSPLLVVVSINKAAKMRAWIEATGRFGVSVLAEEMEPIAQHFAGNRRSDLDMLFEEFGGVPVIRGAVAHFATHIQQSLEAGDHVLFVGTVDKIAHRPGRPLLFHAGAFARLPDNASTSATPTDPPDLAPEPGG